MAIAVVYLRISDFGAAWTPRVGEEVAGKAQKGRVAQGAAAMA
jgi:hypothetical protein